MPKIIRRRNKTDVYGNFFSGKLVLNGDCEMFIRLSREEKNKIRQRLKTTVYQHCKETKKGTNIWTTYYDLKFCGGWVYDPSGKRIKVNNNDICKYNLHDIYVRGYDTTRCHKCGGYKFFAHVKRKSRRVAKKCPVYSGMKKKEACHICTNKRQLHYQCNTCSFRSCYACTMRCQKRTLDCPQCRVGNLPWGSHI